MSFKEFSSAHNAADTIKKTDKPADTASAEQKPSKTEDIPATEAPESTS